MTLLLRGGLVLGPDGAASRADVLVEGGRVAAVGEGATAAGAEIVDATRRLAIPGLVNAHTHSNEAWLRGRFDNLPLDVWLLYAYPVLLAPVQTPREIYVRTALGAMEALRTGTTAVVDFLYELGGLTAESLDSVVAAYRDTGLRALICLGVADRSFYESAAADLGLVPLEVRAQLDRRPLPEAREWLAEIRRLVARFHRPDEGVAIGLAPAGPHRCSDELLLGCVVLAEELDLQVHAHTLEIGRHAAWGRERYGRGTIEHLEAIGFLGPRTHLSHGTWLGEDDPARLAASGASLVHNPLSNLKLGSGRAPVPALRDAGVTVSLGTDGVCCADGQDLFQAVRLAAVVHKDPDLAFERWPGAREALAMASAGGAQAFGDDGLGRVAAGARADLTLLDIDHAAFTPLGDPVLHLGLGAPSAAVCDVLVDGRWVVRDGRLTGVDEPALLAEARAAAPGVLARHDPAWRTAGALEPSVVAGWHRMAELGG